MIRAPLDAHVCVTSPPYYCKFDYSLVGQYGLEASVADYLRVQVAVFHEVQRHLREGGTCFIVIGDTSNQFSPVRARNHRKGGDGEWLFRRTLEPGHREKETLGIPFQLAEALRQDGWVHRATLIWDKLDGGSAVPNSDTAPACHEYVLHMIKWSSKRRPYGNTLPLKSSILRHSVSTHAEHGCTFPTSLVEELLSVCPPTPIIIDPYIGSGTVALAANSMTGATVYGFDLNCSIALKALPHACLCHVGSPLDHAAE